MAANSSMTATDSKSKLDLKSFVECSETGYHFWNTSAVEMKFSVERQWVKAVRLAENKPNYGMGKMDGLLEEVIGNKLELVGPLVDGHLKEIGKAVSQKLRRSKATGLMAPVVQFIPWVLFRHILVLARGYSGEVESLHDGSKHKVSFTTMDSLEKLFSPSRFSGENFIAHRHFRNVPCRVSKRLISVFDGRSVVVATENTPFKMEYSMKTERVTVTFYVQRYSAEKIPVDTSLQSLMNQSEM